MRRLRGRTLRQCSGLRGGGGTWRDPLRICQYIAVSILYFLGLLAVHTHTGLLDTGASVHPSRLTAPKYSSEQAKQYLSMANNPEYMGPPMPLMR